MTIANINDPSQPPVTFTPAPLHREAYLSVVQAALITKEYRFARDIALSWLAAYPGDLFAGLLYARALVGDRRSQQAVPVLESICQADPEFQEAQELYTQARQDAGLPATPDSLACMVSQSKAAAEPENVTTWGRNLLLSRKALKDGNLAQAEQLIQQAVGADPATPLAAVTHLQVLEASGQAPLQSKRDLASFYHKRWPACLQFTLMLADWLMDGGESDQAVALLHHAAARDIGGQVAIRLWGKDHPYRRIWPQDLELAITATIPASVASFLGWNQLAPGELVISPAKRSRQNAGAPGVPLPTANLDETLYEVQGELERVAGSINQPGLARKDGRFPVYVVFSVKNRLEAVYGPEGAQRLEAAISGLVKVVQGKPDQGALAFFPDQKNCAAAFGLKPVESNDPWKLKLALADLDDALAKRGEKIGAVLIVGGPEIVPFHLLPNPIEDDDVEVPSDNPYGTSDENYFIPEWPVGRLPGGRGSEAGLLIGALERIQQRHLEQAPDTAWYMRLWRKLVEWLRPIYKREWSSFGYTAAIWRKASLAVFSPIGDPRSMLVSPPSTSQGAKSSTGEDASSLLPTARLGYFNLHGLIDAPEWYGQRDPVDGQEGPDYPLALSPEEVESCGSPPQVVFSEACYGAYIQNKSIDESMALKFLAAGTPAVVGSSVMAYGSITTPLIAADLLGSSFWTSINDGIPAGEALRRAKINLAREMHGRQGYLDGEDQKTLISFILYGDPMVQPFHNGRGVKSIWRSLKPPAVITTIPAGEEPNFAAEDIPEDTLDYVKHVVRQYLPGMEDAYLTFEQECVGCDAEGNFCPTSPLNGKQRKAKPSGRKLVTLSKKVERAQRTHTHYARLTLDHQGKLVKLVVSR